MRRCPPGWIILKLIIGLIMAVGAPLAHAVLYPLANPGFEAPVLGAGASAPLGNHGWFGTNIGTVVRSSDVGLPATEGSQIAYNDSPVGNNFVLFQDAAVIQADTVYNLQMDLMPLVDDPANNTAIIQLAPNPSYSVNLATAFWNSENLTGFSFPSPNDFELTAGQWTRVRLGFNSKDFPDKVGETIRIILTGHKLAVDNVRLDIADGAPRTYHISASQGDDAHDGLSPATAFASFEPLRGWTLSPGDKVLLRRGEQWGEELNLTGDGLPGHYIELGAYGPTELPRPRIRRQDVEFDRCAVINNPSHWKIYDMDMGHSKVGLYLRYWQDYGNEDVQIYDCTFEDMPDRTADPAKHNYELAWSFGIYIGGNAGHPDPAHPNNSTTMIDGISVTDCEFRGLAGGFGNGWYYPYPFKGRIRNLFMADCVAWDCMNGAFAFFDVDGGLIERVRAIGGGGDVWSGTTLSFLQGCANVTIDNCEFAFIDRANSADGSGMDFEGDTINCVFSNNVVHDNSGPGMLNLATNGVNSNLVIRDNTFFNNAMNSWNDDASADLYSGGTGSGSLLNNGIYTGWNADASISTGWGGFAQSGNRTASFQGVMDRPTWWDFEADGDFEGWAGANDLGSLAVSGGALRATSSGADPYISSPPTWAPVLATRYVWVRMSQTAGGFAQIFWETETDPGLDFTTKSVFFPIIADGQMRDYFVDLVGTATPGGAPNGKGLITAIRLDPTIEAGSDMVIEHIRFVETDSVRQGPPRPRPAWPQRLTIEGEASDNWILESSPTSQAGGALGSVGSSELYLGDNVANATYRPIVSFDTSVLPDDAYLVDATVAVRRVGLVNKDPWTYNQGVFDMDFCEIDMSVPTLGATSAVEASDWQAATDLTNVGRFIVAFQDGLQVRDQINDAALDLIDAGAGGRAQFRLRLPSETNGDGVADYVRLGSADNGVATNRPQMTFSYYNTAPVVTAPQAPAELEVTSPTSTSVRLWWTDRAFDEDGFRVWADGTSFEQAANTWSREVTGLVPNTPVALSVEAFNGTGDSARIGPVNAWTLAAVPAAPLLGNADLYTLDVSIDGSDGNPAGTVYAIRNMTDGNWLDSLGAASATPVWQTRADWGTVTATGLAMETPYEFAVVARNGAGVETAQGPSTLIQTVPVELSRFDVN